MLLTAYNRSAVSQENPPRCVLGVSIDRDEQFSEYRYQWSTVTADGRGSTIPLVLLQCEYYHTTNNETHISGREDVKKHVGTYAILKKLLIMNQIAFKFSGQGKNKLSFSELTINKATICTTRKRHKNATTAEI
ncbi:hypothetical protein Zmor_006614 [Zophobas morio]|uniref:Uncharacterized protein n=1 Tax=Zophobas morio TaxID=2755281 RepID=A0AA38MNR1_9CUCU|nr:hypothetical protein Zmor_006614 [Zophobas morio]